MKLLVIDDQPEITDFLQKSFKDACFAVDTAYDGERGAFLAKTNSYDLIILDNNMPKKTGKEVVKELRAEGLAIPIIMLSVRSETSTKVDLLNIGVDDYVTKPFSFEELHARVKALLRRPKNMEKEIIEIDQLRLDAKKQQLLSSGREIYLTKKEFMLLEYLMRNQGSVLSRAMILEHVWDINADPFSNTIESHILSLRKKLELGGTNQIIITVPGRGYKIKD
jgi:two-component system OmpR family response regulator